MSQNLIADYDRATYTDNDLANTMRYIRTMRRNSTTTEFTDYIRDAVAEDDDKNMADYVLRVLEQIDHHEVTDPYNAAMKMFTALVGWDFNSLVECNYLNEEEEQHHD